MLNFLKIPLLIWNILNKLVVWYLGIVDKEMMKDENV